MIIEKYSKRKKCYVRLSRIRRQISIRLPLDIYDIIDSYEGYNFTDKLINYIFDHEDEKTDDKT